MPILFWMTVPFAMMEAWWAARHGARNNATVKLRVNAACGD